MILKRFKNTTKVLFTSKVWNSFKSLGSKYKFSNLNRFENHIDIQNEPAQPIDRFNENEVEEFQDTLLEKFYIRYRNNPFYKEQHDQGFLSFLVKLENMVNAENRRKRKINKYISEIKRLAYSGREPLKEILISYQIMTNKVGFDSDVLAETFLTLGRSLQSRESNYRVFNDYTYYEFINSFRVHDIIQDLKYALTYEYSFINLDQLSRILEGLNLCGYKESDLMDLIINRIRGIINKKNPTYKYERPSDQPSFGKRNFYEKNLNARKIFYEPLFQTYITKLMNIETKPDKREKPKKHNEKGEWVPTHNYNDVEDLLVETGKYIKEIRDNQYAITDAISNLLDQYILMEQTLRNNPKIIFENPYIKYELYKLQDKLIETGYITYDNMKSVITKDISNEEKEKIKYEQVVGVLKEFVSITFPYLFDEKIDKLASHFEVTEQYVLGENLHLYDDLSLGKCLSSLSEYAKCAYNDKFNKNYFNDIIIPLRYREMDEIKSPNKGKVFNLERNVVKYEYTVYFNKVVDFMKEIENFVENFIDGTTHINSIGYYFQAFSQLPFYSEGIKSKLVNLFFKHFENPEKIISKSFDNNDIRILLLGMASSSYQNPLFEKIADLVSNEIQVENKNNIEFSIKELVDLLWSMSFFKLYKNKNFLQLLLKLDNRNVDSLIINSNNLALFYQLKYLLRYEASQIITIPNFDEEGLKLNFSQDQNINTNPYNAYLSNDTLYDPFKDGLVESIEKSLNSKMKGIEINKSIANFESDGMLKNLTNKPDLITGFYGNKIGIFVAGKDTVDIQKNKPNGYYQVAARLLNDQFKIKSVFVPIHQVFNYDLVNMNISYNQEFNLEKLISSSINLELEHNEIKIINNYLNVIVKKMNNNPDFENLSIIENPVNVQNYLNSLLEVLYAQNELIYLYLPHVLRKKLQQSKLLVEKHIFHFNYLGKDLKVLINEIVNKATNSTASYENFFEKLNIIYDNLLAKINDNLKKISEDRFRNKTLVDCFWKGKRLYIDVVNKNHLNFNQKDIGIELLNNKFMWLTDYAHYKDWEEEIRNFYDNFNFFVKNEQKADHLYYYNNHELGNRNVPVGVFPHPEYVRKIIIPPSENINSVEKSFTNYEEEMKKHRDAHEYYIKKEIFNKNAKINSDPKEIPADISLKVTLLNIKNALKKNLKDQEIVKFLANFDFIDDLIDEHISLLKSSVDEKNQPILLSRNPEKYLNFLSKQDNIIEKYDEFDKLLLKNIKKEEELLEHEKGADKIVVDVKSGDTVATRQIEEKVKNKVEENEDVDALELIPASKWEFVSDMKIILNSHKIDEFYDNDLTGIYSNNGELLIFEKRIRGERNLILNKIIFKAFSGLELSQKEKDYLKYLKEEIKSSNIANYEKIGVKNSFTKRQLKDLNESDLYSINSLPNTKILPNHSNFSMSELILELSNFIDNSTINKFVSELYIKVKYPDFKDSSSIIFEQTNKEPKFIEKEVKETIWRLSGTFNEKDNEKLLQFFRVKRGKSSFDKVWLDIDEKSLKDFLKEANPSDNRLHLLEKWIKLKEKEYQSRINLPPNHLRISDTKINKIIQRKAKKHNLELIRKVFNVEDEKLITSKELENFVNSLCERLYSFNFNYPEIVVEIFDGLENCPNLRIEDREVLQTYRTFFKIDEGSESYDYNEFLAQRPLSLEGERIKNIDGLNEKYYEADLFKRMAKSHINFISPIVDIIINY